MKKVLLDTNALMAMVEFRVDLFTEIAKTLDFPATVCILQGAINELAKIISGESPKHAKIARLAQTLIKKRDVEIIPSSNDVDNLLRIYSRQGYLILTQDQELKRKLTKPYLIIRQKKKIVLIK